MYPVRAFNERVRVERIRFDSFADFVNMPVVKGLPSPLKHNGEFSAALATN
jgi:hypothetical protein